MPHLISQSQRPRRGQLRIFFSYCRAVSRKAALLAHAEAAAAGGARVMVGGPETELSGYPFERLPTSRVFECGRNVEVFDPEQALRVRPDLLLLEDAACLNPEACRHRRRCRDIEELLSRGISVCTTLDVTDLDGLSDMTAAVLGGRPAPGVPDKFFDDADDVVFIDADPHALSEDDLAALALPERGEPALRRLQTLRELALRRLSDRMAQTPAGERLTTGEHILVCISPSPSNIKVIRSAARMASAFHGRFTALYVQQEEAAPGGESAGAAREQLQQNLRLAEQLGAVITTVYGDDPALQISEYARAGGVTKIVIGRTNHRISQPFRRRTLVDRLTRMLPELDIYIIPDDRPIYHSGRQSMGHTPACSVSDLCKVLIVIAAASLIGWAFYALRLREADIITVYLLGMLITAIWTRGWLSSAISALLSVVIFNFLFTEPRFTFLAYDAGYPVTFLVMLISGLITGSLAARIKQQTRQAARQAYRTETLLETSRLLQKAGDETAILDCTARQLGKLLERPVIFYARPDADSAGPPSAYPFLPGQDCGAFLTPEEQTAAHWVFLNNKHAGATTDSFPRARCLYLAVRGQTGALAVAAIPMECFPAPEAYVKSLMVAILDECGLALDKERLNREKQQAELAARQEALRANLLRAVSHDLRTPLTGIRGSAGILMESGDTLPPERRRALYQAIQDDAIWLIDLVENLLSVTRLENGSVEISLRSELIEEIFAEALSHLDPGAARHHIQCRLEDDLLLVRADARLLVQVVINIVNNAIRYTPEGSEIVLSAARSGDKIVVCIADDGPGVPDADKPRLFDMFYTVGKTQGDGRRGLGLGLALCRSIVRAHGGEIWVEDNQPQGAAFRFTLDPVEV